MKLTEDFKRMRIQKAEQLLIELLLKNPWMFFSGASSRTIGGACQSMTNFPMPKSKQFWRAMIMNLQAKGILPARGFNAEVARVMFLCGVRK